MLTKSEIDRIKTDSKKRDANWKVYIDQLLSEREELLATIKTFEGKK